MQWGIKNQKIANKKAQIIKTACIFFTLFAAQVTPCYALPWSNKPLPPIRAVEKISYVNINWWNNFSDDCLRCYIEKAIANNHEVKQASWKVEEYKQQVKLQFSQELPSLSVGADYILNHFQDVVPSTKTNIFAVPFVANYEADIFLKNHDKTKSSKKAYEASKYQEQSVYISLAADVATTYINIIKFDKQIQIQQEFVKIKKEEIQREEKRYKQGVTSVPKLNEYRKSYETAKNDFDDLIKSRDKSLNQLAVLIGESPENSKDLCRRSWDKFYYKNTIPESISSDVVFSRPDILAAEDNLEKAGIDIKVARKEFLPKININGIYSFTNLGSASFGSWNSTLAALLAGATLDLFKGGYKVANLKLNKAKYEEMFENYKQTDLNALKEVNNSLLLIREDSKINSNTYKTLKYQEDNYKREAKSYNSGVISYPNLLTSKEQYLNMKQNQIKSKTNCYVDYITLYKAVGGKL